MDSNPEHFPSFFKVLMGEYDKKLHIPPAFEAKFDVTLPNNVTIKAKRGPSKWDVKIEQFVESLFFSGDGWEMLVADNDLMYGDFVIFRLLSNNVFDFVSYGPNGCEKVVLDPKLKIAATRGKDLISAENEERFTAPSLRRSPLNQKLTSDENNERLTVQLLRRSPSNQKLSQAGSSICRGRVRPRSVAGEGGETLKRTSFVVLLKYIWQKYTLTIPKSFLRETGIEEKHSVVLKNKTGKLFPVITRNRPLTRGGFRTDINKRWQDFWDDNDLALNDTCLFKFVPGSGNVIEVEIVPAK